MGFLNPFKLHDRDGSTDDSEVVVPMDQAPRHPTNLMKAKQVMSSSNNSINLNLAETGSKSSGSSSDDLVFSIECLKREIQHDAATLGTDTAYDRKSKAVNIAIQDIGMGRYNWQLFALAGMGWFFDNAWLQGVAIILPSLQKEFSVPDDKISFTTMSTFIGLCLGASFWGISSDIIGRRIAFNSTLFIAGALGLCVGAASNWIAVCGILAALGFGVGGSLPVDGALFLEFLPYASGNMLTMLSVFWPVGQLVASLIAWIFIPNFSCAPDAKECTRDQNMGWRYTMFTLGAITFISFIFRFFIFHLYESPKFLLSKNRDREAVAAVQSIAKKNRTKTWLTYDILKEVEGRDDTVVNEKEASGFKAVFRENVNTFSKEAIAPLFHTKKLGITVGLLWFIWTTIGMAYPLFNAFLVVYLSKSGNGEATPIGIVFRNYAITSIVGVPGSILACFTVDIPYLGRKGTMAISTMLTGVFVCLFTISSDSNYQLAFTCIEAFVQNISYGVLYAYTPEVLPAPNRGTGTGIASFLNRIAGICAPIIASNTLGVDPKTPIYVSAGLFLSAFVAMVLLPIETRGKQSL